jgi:photosystem II stability/assembly factor-like uncharacterized protein
MTDIPLTSGMGAIWLQIDPNEPPEFLGCHQISDIKQKKGDKTLIWCKDPSAPNRFQVAGSYRGATDPATFTVETVVHNTADFLETVADQTVRVFILKQTTGRSNIFSNYDRLTLLRGVTITQETESGVAARDPGDNTVSMESFEMSAEDWFRIMPLTASRQSTTATQNANVVRFLDQNTGYIGSKAGAGVKAKVLVTTDGGGAWAATAADPFANDEDIISLAVFAVDRTHHRVLAVRDDDVAAALKVAYTDDGGTTWTLVTVGATVAQKALGQAALFALDSHHIWLVTDGGFIYFSNDGGASWDIQDAGVTTANDLYGVHFTDSANGMTFGETDTVLITHDGGNTWSAVTATGGGDNITAGYMVDEDALWLGTTESGGSDNSLYRSLDGGTTWEAITFSGSGTGKILGIEFVNDSVGFLIHDTTGPVGSVFRTVDGGSDWEQVTTPTNTGLKSINVMNNNRCHVCGVATGGTSFIAKVTNTLGG